MKASRFTHTEWLGQHHLKGQSTESVNFFLLYILQLNFTDLFSM